MADLAKLTAHKRTLGDDAPQVVAELARRLGFLAVEREHVVQGAARLQCKQRGIRSASFKAFVLGEAPETDNMSYRERRICRHAG